LGLLPTSVVHSRLGAPAPTSTPSGAGWQLAGSGFTTSGIVVPPPPPPTKVGSYAPTIPPPSSRVSYTGSPSGGAPGAQFGPPGVGSAPVSFGGLSLTPGMMLLLLAVGVGGYLVLR
jgi:hypothetical protein